MGEPDLKRAHERVRASRSINTATIPRLPLLTLLSNGTSRITTPTQQWATQRCDMLAT
jgi:hypothetical protein